MTKPNQLMRDELAEGISGRLVTQHTISVLPHRRHSPRF